MDPVEKKIELTLKSLDKVRKAEADPYLFSRIEAHLAGVPVEFVTGTATLYRFAAVLAALLIMNVMTLFFSSSGLSRAISQEYFYQESVKIELR